MAPRSLIAVLASAATVSAHGWVNTIYAGGQTYTGYDPTSAPWQPDQGSIGWVNWATDSGFVSAWDLQYPDIVCHRNATNSPQPGGGPVAAGSAVSLTWNTWPESHHGPIIDYLAPCGGDCTTVDKSTLQWTKIAEVGQLEYGAGAGTPGKWASDQMMEQGLSWAITIPGSIAPGQYVLRHEQIALHGAGTEGEAQFYPQCINIEVTGSGSDGIEYGTVGTELYSSTDPGVLYNIYNDENQPTYIIPGPPLYTGA